MVLPTCIPAWGNETTAIYTDCLPNCSCSDSLIRCYGYIPDQIPDSSQELVLSNIDSMELWPRRFCLLHESWGKLKALEFISVKVSGYLSLPSGVFDCLGYLKSFMFKSEWLQHFTNYTFTGLSDVTFLDLSGCQMMNWNDLFDTLSIRQNFPKLDHLILSGAGNYRAVYLNLDDESIGALSLRPIAFLDLSYTNFVFNFTDSKKLCSTLEYLSYAGAAVQHTKYFEKASTCGSLKTLEMSDANELKIMFQHNPCKNDILRLIFLARFYGALGEIFLNRIISPSTKFVPSNCELDLFVGSKIKHLHFSQNYLPNFELKLVNDQIETLDISQCSIENLHQKAFQGLGHLIELDLSFNELFKMTVFEAHFSKMFKYNSALEKVQLKGNNLMHIPENTFEGTLHLDHLDLSNNSLTQVGFKVSHLLKLDILDLRSNKIEALDDLSRESLNNLYANQIEANATRIVQVWLQGNPFSCQCKHLSFLQWLAKSPIFSTTRHEYKCQLDGSYFMMNVDALSAANDDCKREKAERLRIVLLSTLLPIGSLIALLIVLLLYKQHKKRLLRRRFANAIRRLKEDVNKFPVFLSYSSDDYEFVRRHMLQQFQV